MFLSVTISPVCLGADEQEERKQRTRKVTKEKLNSFNHEPHEFAVSYLSLVRVVLSNLPFVVKFFISLSSVT
jgi:hypothetical protein